MANNEKSFQRELIHSFKKNDPQGVVYNVCDRFTPGVPDIYICTPEVVFWAELKFHKELKDKQYSLKQLGLTPHQFTWLKRHAEIGSKVNVCLIVGTPKEAYAIGDGTLRYSKYEELLWPIQDYPIIERTVIDGKPYWNVGKL